ncbi:MAG: class I SAM-dependent methyltransferase [Desulfuromonadaceae bacterium]|nr:class I SAM-dependent methyltransferase [Desulfuromonadaceae bacterium]
MQPYSATVESDALEFLVRTIDSSLFRTTVHRLHTLFKIYADTCPVPLPTPGLIITPEIRNQCQCYLPVAEVAAAFYHVYRSALTYPPVLSSTPFHNALSWADVFVTLPPSVQFSANPARLLEALCADRTLLTEFLFVSFLPSRFYNGFERYSRQQEFVRRWLADRNMKTVRCLDAACGTGEGSYDLAQLFSDLGFPSEGVSIDGWTLEPLEVWAAATRRFPHDRHREMELKKTTASLMEKGYSRRIVFSCRDVLSPASPSAFIGDGEQHRFDLILCNGLLGGPILHEKEQLELAIGNLAELLAPDGILLAADSFHGGWKQKCPQLELRALFEKKQLKTFEAGEGIGGLKPD